MYDFIIYGLIGGIGIVISLSILGNFIVWKRISYIGDSIAHTSILGIGLGILTSILPEISIIFVCFILSLVLVIMNSKFRISKDALLVFNTQFALALGFIVLNITNSQNSLSNYLFGSILSMTLKDVIIIYLLSTFVILYTYFYWQKILIITINPEIAKSENINTMKHDIIFLFILSCVIAFSIKLVGALLIPSLSIIPSLIAMNIAKTPIQAIIISFITGCVAIIGGIIISMYLDVPTGALITMILCIIVILKVILTAIFKNHL